MPGKADTAIARTIGIDTGKNTLHVIGLDEKGAIVAERMRQLLRKRRIRLNLNSSRSKTSRAPVCSRVRTAEWRDGMNVRNYR